MKLRLLALLLLLALPTNAWAVYQCFTKPNSAAASFAAQARVYEQDWQTLALGLRGTGVIYAAGACQVTQRAAGANMSVDVTNGCTIAVVGFTQAVTAGNLVIGTADSVNPRWDLIGATSGGVKTVTPGTPASSPLPPTIPDTHVPFAWVYVPAGDTAITNSQITDARPCIQSAGAGSGTVTNVATSSPITGGPITATGTIACATCVTAAAALTSGRLIAGAGAQASAVTNLTGDVTTAGGVVTTLANIPTATPMAGYLIATAIAAPGTPAAGIGRIYVDSTSKTLCVKNDAGTVTCTGGGGGAGTVTTTGSPANGNLTKFTGATSISNADLTGDVTTSGTVATTIANNAVTTAKIADANVTLAKIVNVSAASKLLGRGDSGAGVPQEITLGSGLAMTGTTLTSSGGSGAPPTAQYVTLATDATLTAERVLTGGTQGAGIQLTDGGAGSTITVDVKNEAWVVLSADVTHAQSSTTFSNVTGFSFSACAATTEIRQFEMQLLLTAANITSDWKFQWTGPAGFTMAWGPALVSQTTPQAFFDPVGPTVTPQNLNGATGAPGYGSAIGTHGMFFRGWVFCAGTAGSGTVQLQFAQNTANASDNTVKKGSFMTVRKVIP